MRSWDARAPSPPTCSLLPSRTPLWPRTCQPPGAGSPTRSLCLVPSSPPPAAPAPATAARLPGHRDGKCCLSPPRSPRVAPLEEGSPCCYLLLHVVRLPGLLLDLQPVLQHLHFCLRRDNNRSALAAAAPSGTVPVGFGAQRCQRVSPQPCVGDQTGLLAPKNSNPGPSGEGQTRPDAASPAPPSPSRTPPAAPW